MNFVRLIKYFVVITNLYNQKLWFTRLNEFGLMNKNLIYLGKIFSEVN